MSISTLFMLHEEEEEKKSFFFFSRDVNVNMFCPLKRANCTVYNRLSVCVCFGVLGEGGGIELHGAVRGAP